MFEKATRMRLRFRSAQGILTVEDLWMLSLRLLDLMARALDKQVKDSEGGSFIYEGSARSEELDLKFEIIKHIIKVKLAERSQAAEFAAQQARKAKIRDLIASKQDDALADKSIEELMKEL